MCVNVCTYGTVEDHEAVVEVVMLHGGMAVELGQWVVAPRHTHTHTRSERLQPAPTHTHTHIASQSHVLV